LFIVFTHSSFCSHFIINVKNISNSKNESQNEEKEEKEKKDEKESQEKVSLLSHSGEKDYVNKKRSRWDDHDDDIAENDFDDNDRPLKR
jgi:hypothetical protein